MENTSFLVTARKFRPQLFKDVVGQSHITKTLINAISKNRVHHAYLFNGPRGVGKTTTARIFARAVNCLNLQDGEPCNECEICKHSLDGRSLDIIEIDGASNNSVDDIRKLRENVKFPPVQGKYKMYIIDEVHMLSTSAFNALLKTLEEPPNHLLFVFATTEPHKVPATIMSRCQRFDFRRMELTDITGQISYIAKKEGISIDEQSLFAVAKKADGSMRDAESIFDQVTAFTGSEITYSKLSDALHLIDEEFFFAITQNISESNLKEMFDLASKVVKRGYDYIETLQGLLEHLRNLLAVKITNDTTFLETSETQKTQYLEHTKLFDVQDVIRMIQFISTAEQQIKYSPQQKVRFELTLAQLAYLPKSHSINELIEMVKSGKQFPQDVSNTPLIPKMEPSVTKTISVANEQVIASKKISIDIAVDENKDSDDEIKLSKKSLRFIKKEEIEEKWDLFLDKYANSQYQLTSLAHINVEFVDNGLLLFLNSEVIYNNYTTSIMQSKLKKIVDEFFDGNIQINYKLDTSKENREFLGIKENKVEFEKHEKTEKPLDETKDKPLPIKQENLSDTDKTIINLFNARQSN
ncbi:MAG: DNA polymerase III, subunit gamma and tau [Ignavibacteria bacterium GWF2_33_9]|nr:MAG: DNA polymerase III, subunit gamma and tau [Ignavibacteria bacterium GWF2_33_9]